MLKRTNWPCGPPRWRCPGCWIFGCRARVFAGRCACWDVGGLPSRAGILLPRVRAPLESSGAGQGAGECEEGTSDPWGRVGEGRQTGPMERSPPTGGERPEKARRRRGAEEEHRQEKAGPAKYVREPVAAEKAGADSSRSKEAQPTWTERARQAAAHSQASLRRQGPQESALRQRPRVPPHETPGRASATRTALGDAGFCAEGPAYPPWAAAATRDQPSAA